MSFRSLGIDSKLVAAIDAHDQLYDVCFAHQWQDLLKDEALNKLFLNCQPMIFKRRVGKEFE